MKERIYLCAGRKFVLSYPINGLLLKPCRLTVRLNSGVLDSIAVVEVCPDGIGAMNSYRSLHHAMPEREYYMYIPAGLN